MGEKQNKKQELENIFGLNPPVAILEPFFFPFLPPPPPPDMSPFVYTPI